MRQGTVASGVVGVAPSETWQSSIAMMTGIPPDQESAAITPLWSAASKNGVRTAAVYWPGTESGSLDFSFPAPLQRRRGDNVLFEDVARKAMPAGLADRVEKASPGFQKTLWTDASAESAALYLLRAEKPDLLLIEFTDVETEERETRMISVYARQILEDEDDRVGRIAAAISADTVLALVSGHGFENEDYIVRPRVLMKVPVEVQDGLIGTTSRAVAERVRMLMKDGRQHGIAREVPMTEVAAKAPSLANWVAAFDTPTNFVAKADEKGPALGPGSHLAVDGLWPGRPGYRSVFILAGPDIPARRIGEIDLLQIAPTIAGLVGVELPQARARSLWPVN